VSQAATTLRDARHASGLTQTELAKRLGTSQAAVARLERQGANPTVATLRRALRAAGHGLELRATPQPSSLDLPQLLRHLNMTPAERLRAHQVAYASTRRLVKGTAAGG